MRFLERDVRRHPFPQVHDPFDIYSPNVDRDAVTLGGFPERRARHALWVAVHGVRRSALLDILVPVLIDLTVPADPMHVVDVQEPVPCVDPSTSASASATTAPTAGR